MNMLKSLQEVEIHARTALQRGARESFSAAENCAWLEAVGYPGLKLLAEALSDPISSISLSKDAIGLDLQNVSCVFLADEVDQMIASQGRLFLRNVRHGLYLLPGSLRGNYGIGCPVDPAFALGGERSKNPYTEKLELAARVGIEVDEASWQALEAIKDR